MFFPPFMIYAIIGTVEKKNIVNIYGGGGHSGPAGGINLKNIFFQYNFFQFFLAQICGERGYI